MMGNIGPMEILVVLVIALVVFGPKRLPDLGQSLGKGIREFKGSVMGESDGPAEPAQAPRVEARPVTSHRVEDAPVSTHH
jgi:sec-independent protein translocase protein TatA